MATIHKQHPPPHTVNVITVDDDELANIRAGLFLLQARAAGESMTDKALELGKLLEDLG